MEKGNLHRWVEQLDTGMKYKRGLGIESTAHTFGVSVVDERGTILSNVKEVYKPPPGKGIHPREASRHHAEKAPKLIGDALKAASLTIDDMDFIAYSAGPGLGPCLRVGATLARALSVYYHKPIIPVHHGVGHIELGCLLTGSSDPVVLLLSGGHTMILVSGIRSWVVFGETLDLTLGQLIDQFGRAIGYSSPAGPSIERLARDGKKYVTLPYVVKGNDLSFSGMLTSIKKELSRPYADLAFSLQETAFAMVAEVSERALALTGKRELLVVGGVAANARLSEMLNHVADRQGAAIKPIPIAFAGDCGAQIAWPGVLYNKAGISARAEDAFVNQSWRIDRVSVPWRS